MIGATRAVEEWIRKRHAENYAKGWVEGYAKGWAEGYAKGWAEGEARARQRIREALMPLVEDNPELKKRLDELTNGDGKP